MKKKQIGTILLIVGVVMVGISTLFLFLAFSNLRENDYLIAMSGSMEPTFYEGDVVKVKLRVDADEIYAAPKDADPAGDIIVFLSPADFNDLIVHRAIDSRIEGNIWYFETKGDANLVSDGWILEQNVIGKVVEINPSLWTYSYFLWISILGLGIVCIIVGVVVRQREPRE